MSSLHHIRIITQKELRLVVPYTPQHILRLEKAGKFPPRIRLGQNRVGWFVIEIEAWIASRRAASPSIVDPVSVQA
jgi:prophage regulatory protein